MNLASRHFRVISAEQAEQFVRDGFLLLHQAFPRQVAEAVRPLLWNELPEDPDDPATWTRGGTVIQKCITTDGPAKRIVTQRYRDAIMDLCGDPDFSTVDGIGYAPIRFPTDTPTWQGTGWHVDGVFFHHHVNSAEQGLIGVDLFTDIEPEGGGTAVRPGSHRVVARILAEAEPAGLSPAALGKRACAATEDFPVREVTGKAGDAVLMHPHLVHGSSTNRSDRVRLAGNRCISLQAPLDFDRTDENAYSLVELAVREVVYQATP